MGAWIETWNCDIISIEEDGSHPTWVRGLKLDEGIKTWMVSDVAPYVGAWIETEEGTGEVESSVRRTLRGCVD